MKLTKANNKRADLAQKAVVDSGIGDLADMQCGIIDTLANLRHLCDRSDYDFAELDGIAYRHYTEEKHEHRR